MKRFQCRCGAPIFFDNHQCLQCGAQVGFDPESMSMVPVEQRTDLTYCGNHDHGVCNWLRPAASEDLGGIGARQEAFVLFALSTGFAGGGRLAGRQSGPVVRLFG